MGMKKLKVDTPFYQRPALNIFLSACTVSGVGACVCVSMSIPSPQDVDKYQTHDQPMIKQWLKQLTEQGGGGYGDSTPGLTLIVYCVTAEVRVKRQRLLGFLGSLVEEKLKTDYKGAVDE